ncbi:SAM-dependent methyltransferase [Actinoplanes sp. NPDC049265]|uniref:SAM-dependent methyltransferase n=1 Tax=Actinoplanes sp. NPDC049265 TaxID=3363902 RepID=UPI0037164B01
MTEPNINTDPGGAPAPWIDTSVAHPARRYDYWLGGKDNFAADRESGDAILQRWPDIVVAVRENRGFLQRAVRYAVEEAGVRQFLDIGTGLPTANNTHEVAQAIDPSCRIVYVDNDALVLTHARALLTSTPQGRCAYLDADLREPEKILHHDVLHQTLDLTQPVALMLVAVAHFLSDADEPYRVVGTLLDALPAGSLLVLSHASYDLIPTENVKRLTGEDYPGKDGFYPRNHEEVAAFFDGLDLLGTSEPNQPASPRPVLISEWRREPGQAPSGSAVSTWGGVGRKRVPPSPRPRSPGPPRAAQGHTGMPRRPPPRRTGAEQRTPMTFIE